MDCDQPKMQKVVIRKVQMFSGSISCLKFADCPWHQNHLFKLISRLMASTNQCHRIKFEGNCSEATRV